MKKIGRKTLRRVADSSLSFHIYPYETKGNALREVEAEVCKIREEEETVEKRKREIGKEKKILE